MAKNIMKNIKEKTRSVWKVLPLGSFIGRYNSILKRSKSEDPSTRNRALSETIGHGAYIAAFMGYLAFSLNYCNSLNPFAWKDERSERQNHRNLLGKLFTNPAYVDADTSGTFSFDELSDLFKRAGYGDLPRIKETGLPPSTSYDQTTSIVLPALDRSHVKKAVESYEAERDSSDK